MFRCPIEKFQPVVPISTIFSGKNLLRLPGEEHGLQFDSLDVTTSQSVHKVGGEPDDGINIVGFRFCSNETPVNEQPNRADTSRKFNPASQPHCQSASLLCRGSESEGDFGLRLNVESVRQ